MEEIIDHCTFTECTFSRCTFTDCRFRACDLSLAKVHGSRFIDVRFEASKLVGIDWTKAGDAVISKLFLSVPFDDCLLSYAIFFGLTLPRSRFVRCIAREKARFSLPDAVALLSGFDIVIE